MEHGAWVEIAKLGATELEALHEEFFLLKEGRIRLIGEQLKAIQTEISKRDLSKVNTDKLLELQLRYFDELKGEYVETGQRTKTGPKLNSSDIREELQSVLARYRAGEIMKSFIDLAVSLRVVARTCPFVRARLSRKKSVSFIDTGSAAFTLNSNSFSCLWRSA